MMVAVRTVTDKTSHIGRSGQLAAMAEILARGWNVAIPEGDVGDDVFVAQDDGTRLSRVQVKTSAATGADGTWRSSSILVPFRQLMREGEEVPITYVFVLRTGNRWRFVVIPRAALRDRRRTFDVQQAAATQQNRTKGRPRKNPEVSPKDVAIQFTLTGVEITAWGGQSFTACLDNGDAFELLMQPELGSATAPGLTSSLEPQSPREPLDDLDSDLSEG